MVISANSVTRPASPAQGLEAAIVTPAIADATKMGITNVYLNALQDTSKTHKTITVKDATRLAMSVLAHPKINVSPAYQRNISY